VTTMHWRKFVYRRTTNPIGCLKLSQLFGRMAEQVIEREAGLKRQLESLRIEIDQTKQSKQIAEITDSDFFRDLQLKAKTLRNRDQIVAAIPTSPIIDIVEETAPSLPFLNDGEVETGTAIESNGVHTNRPEHADIKAILGD